jgi:hypothetical protein
MAQSNWRITSCLGSQINISEGLSLANSLVEGTEWEEAVVEFKKKRDGTLLKKMLRRSQS